MSDAVILLIIGLSASASGISMIIWRIREYRKAKVNR
jgi:hypothetical protein